MRVLYFDAALTDQLGHFANECRFFVEALRSKSVETVVFGNRAIEPGLAAELGAHPHFRYHPNSAPSTDPICGWLLSFNEVARATLEDLSRISGVSSKDIILYDCAKPAQIMGLVQWVQRAFEPTSSPKVLITLGWPPGLAGAASGGASTNWQLRDGTAMLYRYACAHIEPPFQQVFRFACPDATMSDAYGALLGRPVSVLPNPHRATTGRRSRKGVREPCIAFLGEQRPNKGYGMVPQISEKLLSSGRRLRILVQNSWQLMHEQNEVLKRMASADSRLSLHIVTVDAGHWNALLDACDLIVLPYDQDTYSSVTSGIAAEAIANAIPQAVPARTCMARLLKDYGSPGVVFERSEVEPIVSAVLDALGDMDQFAERALAAASRWETENSPAQLVKAILG